MQHFNKTKKIEIFIAFRFFRILEKKTHKNLDT